MDRLEARRADRLALLSELACPPQHLMQDDAVHRLRALHNRQPLDVAIPVLARAILIGADRAVGKVDLAAVTVAGHRRTRRCGRCDLGLDHDPRPRLANLIEEAALPPTTTSVVMCRAGQVEV